MTTQRTTPATNDTPAAASPTGPAEPSVTPSTRERILTEALTLFVAKGYDATSMREIAEQLGITKAALYYHFDSKDGIVRALVADMLQRIEELCDWAQANAQDPQLPHAILQRWCDLMEQAGLDLFRFVAANRALVMDIKHGHRSEDPDSTHRGMHSRMEQLFGHLTPEGADVEQRLRARMALASINIAAIGAVEMDVSDQDVLRAARNVAFDLLPTP